MAIKIQPIADVLEKQGLKCLVYGPAGIGKTVLSTTSGEKTLLISSESGLLSLNKIIEEEPEIGELIDVYKVNDIDGVNELYEEIADHIMGDDLIYKWIILDSITEIAEVLLSEEKGKSTDPRKAYGVLIDDMSKIIRKFRDLPLVNVLMTSKQIRVTDEHTGITMYGPMMPGQQLGLNIPYWFDEVFAMRILTDDEGIQYRALQTQPDLMYSAKDRSGYLGVIEKPDLKYIKEKANGGKLTKTSTNQDE